MRIKMEIGNGPVEVEAWVNMEDEEVFCVMWQGVNILDLLELETLNKIAEAAAKRFAEEMSEP